MNSFQFLSFPLDLLHKPFLNLFPDPFYQSIQNLLIVIQSYHVILHQNFPFMIAKKLKLFVNKMELGQVCGVFRCHTWTDNYVTVVNVTCWGKLRWVEGFFYRKYQPNQKHVEVKLCTKGKCPKLYLLRLVWLNYRLRDIDYDRTQLYCLHQRLHWPLSHPDLI